MFYRVRYCNVYFFSYFSLRFFSLYHFFWWKNATKDKAHAHNEYYIDIFKEEKQEELKERKRNIDDSFEKLITIGFIILFTEIFFTHTSIFLDICFLFIYFFDDGLGGWKKLSCKTELRVVMSYFKSVTRKRLKF